MRKSIELLAPAGDLARLKTAVRYGADAVYLGGKRFSLRSRASNFELEDIAEGVAFAREYGAHVHVTVNIIPHEEDFEGLDDYLRQLESVGVHAVIVASPSIVRRVKTVAPKLEVHLSTQMSSTNSQAVRFLSALRRGPGRAGTRVYDGTDPSDLRSQRRADRNPLFTAACA